MDDNNEDNLNRAPLPPYYGLSSNSNNTSDEQFLSGGSINNDNIV